MSSRKALRDFYKLQAQAEPSSAPGSAPEPAAERKPSQPPAAPDARLLEPEDEPLTTLTELDASDVDIAAFVHRIAAEQSLPSFLATVHQISREQATLTSAQRELVNDNYKKLIQAAETLGYLSAQGDLAGLNALASSVQVIADVTQRIGEPAPSDAAELRARLQEKLAGFEPAARSSEQS